MPQNVRTITRYTLADALTTLRWDIKRHGSLLCIAPDKTPLVMPGPPMEGFGIGAEWLSQQNKLARERLGTPPPGGWMPQDFVGAFGQSLRRFGVVTALGPAERVAYSRNPALPRFEITTSAFLETVTEAQWQQLCGAGLAIAQCTATQRAVLAELLPESTQIYDASFQNVIPLNSIRRSQLVLSLELVAIVQGLPSMPLSFTLLGSACNFPLKPQVPPREQDVLPKVPNRGGAGQLNPQALSGQVSLEGENVTVSLLLERATRVSGVSIQADVRVAKLPVWSQGTTLATGELLQALCFALGGVFRKTNDGFLLVEDVVPLQTRRARVAEWYSSARAGRPRETQAVAERFDALMTVPFASGAVFALNDAQRRQFRTAHHEGKELTLTYAELTESQRRVVDAEQKKVQESLQRALQQPLVLGEVDKVMVLLSLQLQARVPDAPPFYVGEMTLKEKSRLRVRVKGQTLLLQGSDKAALKTILQAAQGAGVAALWLEASPELLEVALAEKLLPVWACVPVLRSNDGTPARNSLGETWRELCRRRFRRDELDWLDPGVEGNLAVARATIKRYCLPQVAGLVLTDIVPPGFREEVSDCHTEELGYTPERQRAFLKQHSIEPTDVIVSYGTTFQGERSNRTFDPTPELAETWLAEREDEADGFLLRLQQGLLQEHPSLPLWWKGGGEWALRWKAKQAVPLFYPYYEPEPRKNHEAQWVIAPEKWTDKTSGNAVLDLRAMRMADLLAGLRRGEF